jgi:hypothetical protein
MQERVKAMDSRMADVIGRRVAKAAMAGLEGKPRPSAPVAVAPEDQKDFDRFRDECERLLSGTREQTDLAAGVKGACERFAEAVMSRVFARRRA